MISIVVSSYKEEYFNRFSENVAKTVGVPFEIIKIHNPGLMGICKAYNQGAEKAQYPYLCFVHEDVEFRTTAWGPELIDIFEQDATIVLAGLAGSKYKSDFISGWGNNNANFDRVNVNQVGTEGEIIPIIQNPLNERHSEVRTLDGVFLFTRKSTWDSHPFNEEITGFHFYDIEYSLRLQSVGRNVVLYSLDIIHYSMGNYDDNWVQAAIEFHKKYKSLINDHRFQQKLSALEIAWIKRFWCFYLLKNKLNLMNKARLLFIYRQSFGFPLVLIDLKIILRLHTRVENLKKFWHRA